MPLHYLGAKVPTSNVHHLGGRDPLPRRPWRVRWQHFHKKATEVGRREVVKSVTVHQLVSLLIGSLVLAIELFELADLVISAEQRPIRVRAAIIIALPLAVAVHVTTLAVTWFAQRAFRRVSRSVPGRTGRLVERLGTTYGRGVGAVVAFTLGALLATTVGTSGPFVLALFNALAVCSADRWLTAVLRRRGLDVPGPNPEAWAVRWLTL